MPTPIRTYGPQFTTSPTDRALIRKIATRAIAMSRNEGIDYDILDADMDLTACHVNGCQLDLAKLLAAPDADFGHDVYGIRRFLDRSTGQLTQGFDPRCAMPDRA